MYKENMENHKPKQRGGFGEILCALKQAIYICLFPGKIDNHGSLYQSNMKSPMVKLSTTKKAHILFYYKCGT